VINSDEFPWTNFPGTGGLTLNEVRDALCVFAAQPNLAAFVVAGYNPDLDSDGQGARKLVDLLADVLSTRLETTNAASTAAADPVAVVSAPSLSSSSSTSEPATAAFPPGTESDAEPDLSSPAELPDATEPDTTVS
jgi:hypothetical protein